MPGGLDDDTIDRMLELVEPGWTLRDAAPVEGGFSRVVRLTVAGDGPPRDLFLKAAPDADDPGVATDARLLAALATHTSIPVPEVVGAVDDHPDVPAPFHLTRAVAGEERPYAEVGRMSDGVLEGIARQMGTCLGELHPLDAVESFGHVVPDATRRYVGERPGGSLAELGVADGGTDWRAYLRAWVDRELDRHADSRFASLTPRLRTWCDTRVEAIEGPFEPVLGRNDHGLHNLLVDPDAVEVTAMLDWAYTLAVTPAFDLAFAEYIYGGGFLTGLPDIPDRREMVRNALLTGYRSAAPDLLAAASRDRPLYGLLAAVRVMNDFDLLVPQLPDGREGTVADGIRSDVESMLDANPE